ncbi:aryl-sulfate sulfotransferase [Pedobacter sp. MC2016-14]|uniref:arylsulfotransferase family protein n=1 Tax=Pedobacter sp. MC2016-14 TaxID=2897327 RepID=UPI001E42191E|nr:aryl-sulfate sulfotransferase [Pedobacter sp. MC2016-14]MCD0490541.1 aryl-sulfate sulfotransferase [Pedobacter sp. MC2016-14]
MIKIKKNSFLGIAVVSLILIAVLLWKKESILNTIWPLRIEHIDLYHVPENRLRFKIKVKTNRKSDAYLKYWKKGSSDTLYSELSSNSSEHLLWILNSTGRTDYTFQVIAHNASSSVLSKVYPLKSKSIYEATPAFKLEEMDKGFAKEMENKYFLTQILTEPGSAIIIDGKGTIVWYEVFKKGVKVSHWTPQRTIINIVGSESIPSSGGDEIIEMDLAGNIVTHLKYGRKDMDKLVHHEVRKDEEGNIYALTFDKRTFNLSSVGGAVKDTVQADGIVVFNKDGKKIWEWSFLDQVDLLADPNILKTKKDMVHANSVFKDAEGNFLISFRDLNQIWKIDYKTKKVVWKFGKGGDFKMSAHDYFSAQHFAHINKDGHLMFMDNGTATKITRALSFKLDEQAHQYTPEIDVALPKDYFTAAKGNAQIINGDKVLFCLTEPQSLVITDKKGKFLWRVNIDGDPYRVEEVKDFKIAKPVWHD